MICPILSQASRDPEGNTVWDHHECIEGACTFWAQEISDCGIRATGLATIQRMREPLPSLDPAALEPIMSAIEKVTNTTRETGLKLLEGVSALEEPMRGTGLEMGSRVEALNARITRLEDGIEGIKKLVTESASGRPAFMDDLEQSLTSVTRRLGGVTDRFSALSESLETVSTQVGTLQGAHEDISAALSLEAERRRHDDQRQRRDEAMALNARGVALHYKGAAQAAEASFRSALDLDPGFAEAHNNLGLTLSRQGRDAEAEACFQKALELDPGMGEAVNNLGFLFHQNMQFEKAVEMFKRSALDAGDASVAYTNLGNACYKLGRYSEAVDAWNKAVERDPLNEPARTALKMFQQEQGTQG
ncbi:MAG TPA: tetratricopeptide repeat protein [Candidatus Polarisedimenticolia bacterium]|jgi:Flp pilus assembly protein TadD